MLAHARCPATYQDILDLPEHLIGEILAGELYVSPRPANRHALAAASLGGDLVPPFMRGRGGPGGWWILDKPEVHVGDEVFVPDLAGWRRERLTEIPQEAYFTVLPDWVCEILSPKTARTDRLVKMPMYARLGINHAWLIDPTERTLEVYRRHEDAWLFLGGFSDDARVRAEPFDAVELELDGL